MLRGAVRKSLSVLLFFCTTARTFSEGASWLECELALDPDIKALRFPADRAALQTKFLKTVRQLRKSVLLELDDTSYIEVLVSFAQSGLSPKTIAKGHQKLLRKIFRQDDLSYAWAALARLNAWLSEVAKHPERFDFERDVLQSTERKALLLTAVGSLVRAEINFDLSDDYDDAILYEAARLTGQSEYALRALARDFRRILKRPLREIPEHERLLTGLALYAALQANADPEFFEWDFGSVPAESFSGMSGPLSVLRSNLLPWLLPRLHARHTRLATLVSTYRADQPALHPLNLKVRIQVLAEIQQLPRELKVHQQAAIFRALETIDGLDEAERLAENWSKPFREKQASVSMEEFRETLAAINFYLELKQTDRAFNIVRYLMSIQTPAGVLPQLINKFVELVQAREERSEALATLETLQKALSTRVDGEILRALDLALKKLRNPDAYAPNSFLAGHPERPQSARERLLEVKVKHRRLYAQVAAAFADRKDATAPAIVLQDDRGEKSKSIRSSQDLEAWGDALARDQDWRLALQAYRAAAWMAELESAFNKLSAGHG